jgi:phage baseplate assembly protein W
MAEGRRNFIGRGWPFPVAPDPSSGRLALVEGAEVIRRSLLLILSTAPNERLMRPGFGCGIHELVFEPNTPTLRAAVAARVRDGLIRWEPRVDVLEVRADADPREPNLLLIRVDYRVRTNNAVFNLVYPFFLNEGTQPTRPQ